jgi:hypothetical protein
MASRWVPRIDPAAARLLNPQLRDLEIAGVEPVQVPQVG